MMIAMLSAVTLTRHAQVFRIALQCVQEGSGTQQMGDRLRPHLRANTARFVSELIRETIQIKAGMAVRQAAGSMKRSALDVDDVEAAKRTRMAALAPAPAPVLAAATAATAATKTTTAATPLGKDSIRDLIERTKQQAAMLKARAAGAPAAPSISSPPAAAAASAAAGGTGPRPLMSVPKPGAPELMSSEEIRIAQASLAARLMTLTEKAVALTATTEDAAPVPLGSAASMLGIPTLQPELKANARALKLRKFEEMSQAAEAELAKSNPYFDPGLGKPKCAMLCCHVCRGAGEENDDDRAVSSVLVSTVVLLFFSRPVRATGSAHTASCVSTSRASLKSSRTSCAPRHNWSSSRRESPFVSRITSSAPRRGWPSSHRSDRWTNCPSQRWNGGTRSFCRMQTRTSSLH
jgi:hypothetical protein